MDWFSGLQKNLTAAATDAAERAQKLALQAGVQAKAYAEQASVQAKAYAEQATETAKVLAAQATEEAQIKIAQLKQAAAGTGASESTSQAGDHDLTYYGITDSLIELVSNMTYSTFSDSPTSTATAGPGEGFRLSPWQEKHAMLVLGRVEQLQHLRYALCPKRMDEQQFWTVYFAEVKALLPPQAFGLPEAASAARVSGAGLSAASAATSETRGQAAGGGEAAGGAGGSVQAGSRLASGASAGGSDSAGLQESAGAGDSSDDVDVEDGEQLDELEDDPELAAYLQEALALDDEQGELGSADLGSVADDDLDDYINQLQDEEVHSKLSTPAKLPDA